MKKLFMYILVGCISVTCAISCSKDDDNDDYGYPTESGTSTAQAKKDYASVVKKIADSEAKLASLRAEAQKNTGGRYIVIQEQISNEMQVLSNLKQKKKSLEKQLGL